MADEKIRTFQRDSAGAAGIFHHLITLPTYHTAALSTDDLAKGYFGDQGMLAYVKGVQRREIREGIACVSTRTWPARDIGDNHKEYFAGDAALKAGGEHNTMNQFALSAPVSVSPRRWRRRMSRAALSDASAADPAHACPGVVLSAY